MNRVPLGFDAATAIAATVPETEVAPRSGCQRIATRRKPVEKLLSSKRSPHGGLLKFVYGNAVNGISRQSERGDHV
ncbi:MAG: hypothetical protein KIT61_10675 [Pyrinomonadaceae bacterium]|nr:hypothetical protein [Blastocatellia bacterium]MCW5957040.1 hypothetical protein [Pyrinomonadaceae bacterium]